MSNVEDRRNEGNSRPVAPRHSRIQTPGDYGPGSRTLSTRSKTILPICVNCLSGRAGHQYNRRTRKSRPRSVRSRSRSARYRSRSARSDQSRILSSGLRLGRRVRPSKCLAVLGLSLYTTELRLYEAFAKYGAVEKIRIVMSANAGRSRGYGFVYYKELVDAEVAKERCNDLKIDGQRIAVDFARFKRPHAPTPGVYLGRDIATRAGETASRRTSYDRYDDESRYGDPGDRDWDYYGRRRDGARRDGARRDGARRDGARRDGARRDGGGRYRERRSSLHSKNMSLYGRQQHVHVFFSDSQ